MVQLTSNKLIMKLSISLVQSERGFILCELFFSDLRSNLISDKNLSFSL